MDDDDEPDPKYFTPRAFSQVKLHKDPDFVCLEGGCVSCDDEGQWWFINDLATYAHGIDRETYRAFLNGRDARWHNRLKRRGLRGEPFHGVGL